MDDWLKDVGLQIAGNLPGALVGLVGGLVILVWAGYKIKESDLDQGSKWFFLVVIAVFIIVGVGGFSKAYTEARNLCRQIGATEEVDNPYGLDSPLGSVPLRIPNADYHAAKCDTIWPNGSGL